MSELFLIWVEIKKGYTMNGSIMLAKKMAKLLKKRKIDGKPISKGGKSFAREKGHSITRYRT